jgi:hypothetical protein
MKSLRFGEMKDSVDIMGMTIPEGEFVPFVDAMKAQGPVELRLKKWKRI